MTVGETCLHPGGLDFTAKLVEDANLSRKAEILDAGCGAGETVIWLNEHGYKAKGLDKNQELDAPWFMKGSLQDMPYMDSCFDAVISECTAFICGNMKAMLQESFRVLREDGQLLLADVYFEEEKPLPQFNDNRPVTMNDWRMMIENSGFEIMKTEDVSAAWKPFVVEQLWAGRTLEDLWGGCLAEGQINPATYKPGYFLLRAKKKGVDGNE